MPPKVGVYNSMNFHTLNTPRSRADMLAPEEFLGPIQPLHITLWPLCPCSSSRKTSLPNFTPHLPPHLHRPVLKQNLRLHDGTLLLWPLVRAFHLSFSLSFLLLPLPGVQSTPSLDIHYIRTLPSLCLPESHPSPTMVPRLGVASPCLGCHHSVVPLTTSARPWPGASGELEHPDSSLYLWNQDPTW